MPIERTPGSAEIRSLTLRPSAICSESADSAKTSGKLGGAPGSVVSGSATRSSWPAAEPKRSAICVATLWFRPSARTSPPVPRKNARVMSAARPGWAVCEFTASARSSRAEASLPCRGHSVGSGPCVPSAPPASWAVRCSRGGSTRGFPPSGSVTTPPSSVSTRSAEAAISGSWVITMIVIPSRWSSLSARTVFAAFARSSAPVGSSARTTAGRPATARARATRCRSPPESCLPSARDRPPSPKRLSAAAVRPARSRLGTRRTLSPSAAFVAALASGRRWAS